MSVEKTEITEEDWRGILALVLVVGMLVLIALGAIIKNMELVYTVIAAMSAPVSLTVKWYFEGKKTGTT